jgi:hypothetical protein
MDSSADRTEAVQKLLKLKRYEQPPPRFFNDFSSNVLARIEAGEAKDSLWQRFGFDLRPAFAATAGAFACGLVIYGVATADAPAEREMTDAFPLIAPSRNGGEMLATQRETSPIDSSSTNPVVSYGTPIDRSVFGSAGIMPAAFSGR